MLALNQLISDMDRFLSHGYPKSYNFNVTEKALDVRHFLYFPTPNPWITRACTQF